MVFRCITQGYAEANTLAVVFINQAYIHLNCVTVDKKEAYARRGVVTVYFDSHDNTLVGSGKFIYNAYKHSNKVANIMEA